MYFSTMCNNGLAFLMCDKLEINGEKVNVPWPLWLRRIVWTIYPIWILIWIFAFSGIFILFIFAVMVDMIIEVWTETSKKSKN